MQTPYYIPPGFTPRKLVIERKRREYKERRGGVTEEKLDILLKEKEIQIEKIYPDPENMSKFCLPLEVFDNTEWDERTPTEWESLAPLPCRVLLESGKWSDGAAVQLVEGSNKNGAAGIWNVQVPAGDEKGELHISIPRKTAKNRISG